MPNRRSIVFALAAAVLFGVSTPAAKFLVAQTDPWLTAGLLYLGSGTGLGIAWLLRRGLSHTKEAPLRPSDLPWLAAAIARRGSACALDVRACARSRGAGVAAPQPRGRPHCGARLGRIQGALRQEDRHRHGAHHHWRVCTRVATRRQAGREARYVSDRFRLP